MTGELTQQSGIFFGALENNEVKDRFIQISGQVEMSYY